MQQLLAAVRWRLRAIAGAALEPFPSGQKVMPEIYTVRLHQKQSGFSDFAAGATLAATRFARGATAGAGVSAGLASRTGGRSAGAIATTTRFTDWACAVAAMPAIDKTVKVTAAGLAIISKNDITQLLFNTPPSMEEALPGGVSGVTRMPVNQ